MMMNWNRHKKKKSHLEKKINYFFVRFLCIPIILSLFCSCFHQFFFMQVKSNLQDERDDDENFALALCLEYLNWLFILS